MTSNDSSPKEMIQTTAGDWERESKSRRYNLYEAFLIYLLILIMLWPIGYLLGVLPGHDVVQVVATVPLVLGALYLLFVSPFVHKDSLESWGLGNPRTVWRMLRQGPLGRRAAFACLLAALFLGLNFMNYWRWPDVARFMQLHKTPLRYYAESYRPVRAELPIAESGISIPVSPGHFSINGVAFEVRPDRDTLEEMIAGINDGAAGVVAGIERDTGRVRLRQTDGALLIGDPGDTSNLLDALHLSGAPLQTGQGGALFAASGQMPGALGMAARLPRLFVVFVFGAALSLLILLYGIRYDNFLPAIKTGLTIALAFFAIICLGAYIQRGPDAFAHIRPAQFAIDILGYVFWGFTQQLLFSSYFGTRLRKAFPPSTNPENARPPGERWPMALRFGGGAAVLLAPALYLLLRAVYPEESIPLTSMVWFACFVFPAGALYGYFFAVDRRRLLIATLGGSFFGLIHIDSYGLVIGTWLLGIVLVYVFMENRNRNLVALGVIHGLNGSTLNQLFSKGQSGALEIDYTVGPWNVNNPTLAVVIIPLLCIAAYAVLLIWSERYTRASE